MKLLLMISSLVWLLVGVALLALIIANPDLVPSPFAAPVSGQGDANQAAGLWQAYAFWLPWLAGIAWVTLFLIPALGLAALAVILDALARRDLALAKEAARRERAEPAKRRPVTEKVEPTIGDY